MLSRMLPSAENFKPTDWSARFKSRCTSPKTQHHRLDTLPRDRESQSRYQPSPRRETLVCLNRGTEVVTEAPCCLNMPWLQICAQWVSAEHTRSAARDVESEMCRSSWSAKSVAAAKLRAVSRQSAPQRSARSPCKQRPI